MHYIGKSKISKIYPKSDVYYPSLRLPKVCDDAIGEIAHIFETTYKSCKALQVVLGDYPSNNTSAVAQPVAQSEAEVVQPSSQNDVETRISAIEKEIILIRGFIFRNAHAEDNKNKNKALKLKQTTRARSLAGYDVALTWRRSGVRIASSPLVFSIS